MLNTTRTLKKSIKSMLSFVVSLSISSTPALAQPRSNQTVKALEVDLEKGVDAEYIRQNLSAIYTSSDDKLYLEQVLAPYSGSKKIVFKVKSAKMHTENLDLVLMDGTKIYLSNLFDKNASVNGQAWHLNGVSLRQAIKNLQSAIDKSTKADMAQLSILINDLNKIIFPQAHASVLLNTSVLFGILLGAAAQGHRARVAYENYLNPPMKRNSTEEEMGMLVQRCREEKSGPRPYQQSASFNHIRKIELVDKKIFDSVQLKTVGTCNQEHVARFARISALEIVPDGTAAFCEWADKLMACMNEYRRTKSETVQASLEQQTTGDTGSGANR